MSEIHFIFIVGVFRLNRTGEREAELTNTGSRVAGIYTA